jgi:hypothetical protein
MLGYIDLFLSALALSVAYLVYKVQGTRYVFCAIDLSLLLTIWILGDRYWRSYLNIARTDIVVLGTSKAATDLLESRSLCTREGGS